MNMDLVLLGVFNAVLLVLLLVAFKLIRSGGVSDSEKHVVDVSQAAAGSDDNQQATEPTIDLRSSPEPSDDAPAPDLSRGPQITMPIYTDPVFEDDGSSLPTESFEAPTRTVGPAPAAPLPGAATPLAPLPRSAIVVDSSLNGSGPTPKELLFSVIETLGGIGFRLNKDSANYGLLVDDDGNTASIELTKRSTGTDRIAIAVDSPRAVEALAVLEIWHRSRLGATDQVRLSARIR